MEPSTLSFAALNARIDKLPEHPSLSMGNTPPKSRLAFAIGMLAGALGLLAGKLLPSSRSTLIFVSIMLVIELAGFGFALATQLPREALTFRRARQEYAEQLDFDLPHHLALIEWLRRFPPEQLSVLKAFIQHRHERMKEKLPLLTGSLDKVGALPVIAALYLQFKDAHWPPHPSWTETLLIFALLLFYWLSLMQINVRFRAQLYSNLLEKALAGPQAEKISPASLDQASAPLMAAPHQAAAITYEAATPGTG